MRSSTDLFFELIQVGLKNKTGFDQFPTEEEWDTLYALAHKQSLASALFPCVEKSFADIPGKKPKIVLRWYLAQQKNKKLCELQATRAKQLTDFFSKAGFRSCILKGLGTAQYYDYPENRQCGDIDIWIEGDRDAILAHVKSCHLSIGHVDIKHSDIHFFNDIPVEVHVRPSWMYNLVTDQKLQAFFHRQAARQFDNYNALLGFTHTTVDFDLVYSMVHIYRHIFSEGIGLRQIMDYYYISLHSTSEQRKSAFAVLQTLGMARFVGGIMWILKAKFGMKDSLLLCSTNEKHGSFLLNEILTGGNFGQFDSRITRIDKNLRFKRGFIQLKRNLRFVAFYPSEVLWSPFWKFGHYCWRKKKGYL